MNNRLVYLMGAGRSGTTILATILGNCNGVTNLGELHQLPEHAAGEGNCSCGRALNECPYWSQVDEVDAGALTSAEYRRQASELESHSRVHRYFSNPRRALAYDEYVSANQSVFDQLGQQDILVDSAKFIGRALALASLPRLDCRFVYVVRDPRGVVSSFEKKVQTSRHWLSATTYYFLVNVTAEVVSRTLLRGRVLKVRYEDILSDPHRVIERIAEWCGFSAAEVLSKLDEGQSLDVGHIIGGNRIAKRPTVKFDPELAKAGHSGLSGYKRLLSWILTLPLNLINGYRVQ